GEVFADLCDPVDRAVAWADHLKHDDRTLDEVRCSRRPRAGDDGIGVAHGIADCRNTVVGSQRKAAAPPQAPIERAMDVSDDVVVVDGRTGHGDRLKAVKFVAGALSLGPGEKLAPGHVRFTESDTHLTSIAPS